MSQENVEIMRQIYAALDVSVPGSVSAKVQTHLTAHLWTLKDGVRMQSYWERAEALEAVGLSE